MKIITSIILLCIPLLTFSQYKPLENLDLESGNFCVLAKFSESDPSSLRDSLGEFYINDLATLKILQNEWFFDQEAPFYACGYHYSILICQNGEAIDGFSINLNCNTLSGSKGCFNFDNDKLRLLFGKTKTFHKTQKSFSIDEGRKYLTAIKGDSNLIFAPEPIWMTYDGNFEFTFNYPEGTQEYYPDLEDKIDPSLMKYSSDSILAKLKIEINSVLNKF